eukprot:749273-Hanusia_phi.AAC.5
MNVKHLGYPARLRGEDSTCAWFLRLCQAVEGDGHKLLESTQAQFVGWTENVHEDKANPFTQDRAEFEHQL